MGKYLRKSKLTGDVVAVMDVSPSSLGVRTRAKTLALQKLLASKSTDTPPPEQNQEVSYLQLRSRKLEKPPLQQQNPNRRLVTSNCVNVRTFGDPQILAGEEIEANCEFGSEATSFGENNTDYDGRDRGTRESTPCSFIRESNDIITPGSSSRPTNGNASNRITQRIMPSAQEIEEFFALHVQEQQRLFSEKYNFDIVNEKPLKGRYEWVRVDM